MSMAVKDISISDPQEQTFRKDRDKAVALIVITLSFLAMELYLAVGSVIFPNRLFGDPAPNTILCVAVLLFLFLFAWAALDQIYSRLNLSSEIISYHSLFSSRTIPIHAVIEVNYLNQVSNKGNTYQVIEIVSRTSTLKLYLSAFEDQEPIVNWIHDLIAPEYQHSFQEFLSTWKKSEEDFNASRPVMLWIGIIGFGLITMLGLSGYPNPLWILSFVTIPLMFLFC